MHAVNDLHLRISRTALQTGLAQVPSAKTPEPDPR